MTSSAKMEGEPDSFVSNPLVFVDDALQFNKDLLYGRTKHYIDSLDLKVPISFFDRGIPDVLAYMDFFDQSYDKEFYRCLRKSPLRCHFYSSAMEGNLRFGQ